MSTVFGPPSEPVDVAAFLRSTQGLAAAAGSNVLAELSQEKMSAVMEECSVADVQKSLFDAWDNPRISAYLLNEHELAVDSLHLDKKPSKKRRRAHFTDTVEPPSEVADMQRELNSVNLQSWKLQPEAAVFIRTSQHSDYNALRQPKPSSVAESSQGTQAIIIVSIYKRTSWNPGLLARVSQHALLSSQTLGNLFQVIPCPSKETPQEIVQDGKIIGYTSNDPVTDNDCVICIEEHAYGGSHDNNDYSHKLMEQLKKQKGSRMKKAATSMHETHFHSLVLRINEPYWLLHAGNCEHFIVIEQIRLMHKTDPPGGYPLTLQMTPLLLDLCRTCRKVPAVWSVVNDGRLGETPYLICTPCWRDLEEEKGNGVVVVPLPKHSAGW